MMSTSNNSCAVGKNDESTLASSNNNNFVGGAALPSFDTTATGTAAKSNGNDIADALDVEEAWGVLEGFDELDDDARQHHQAFYNGLLPHISAQSSNAGLFHKKKYLKIIDFVKKVQQGMSQRQLKLDGYSQAYCWYDRYGVVTRDNGIDILVEKPKGNESNEIDIADWKEVTYYERLFIDISKVHCQDHIKSVKFYKKVQEYHPNVPRWITNMFYRTCPHCIGRSRARKPAAANTTSIVVPEGGFNSRGQIDLIDFQSQKDGKFRFLLMYIDHGVNKLTCVPLVSRRARTVAFALYKIFADQGSPDILQTRNGRETPKSSMDNNCRLVNLTNKDMDATIKELMQFWPKVALARGRHYQFNDGVERVIRTVQEKLAAWMSEQQSSHWSIGCYDVQWRINTKSCDSTEQTPYFRTFGRHPCMSTSALRVDPKVLDDLHVEAELTEVIESECTRRETKSASSLIK